MSSWTPPNNSTEPPVELASPAQFTFIAVTYFIIFLFGVLGNSLVIAAVVLCRKLQTATNVFVVSLAITDLLSCMTLPFQAYMFLSYDRESRLPSGLCAFIGAVTIVCLMGSILLLALIAFNRCYLITQPKKNYSWLYTTKKLVAMTSVAWLYPLFVLVMPQAFGVGQLGYSPDYKACLWNEQHPLAYVSDIIVAFTFFFTFVIILVCYVKIWRYIRHHVRRLHRHHSHTTPGEQSRNLDELSSTQEHNTDPVTGPHNGSRESSQTNPGKGNAHHNANGHQTTVTGKPRRRTKSVSTREIEITKNLFYVVCAFILCILPYAITLVLPRHPILDLLVLYASIPLVFNGCVNPIIYAYKHPTMKVVFRYIIRCQISSIPKPSQCLRRMLNARQQPEVGMRSEAHGFTFSGDARNNRNMLHYQPSLSYASSKRDSPNKPSSLV